MDLEECLLITDATLIHLAMGCPRLEKLVSLRRTVEVVARIEFARELDSRVKLIPRMFTVREQSLSHCELITDEGIRQLALSPCAAEHLAVLELDNCPLITDASLDHLLQACHNLERIELYDCQLITRAGIRRLRVKYPRFAYSTLLHRLSTRPPPIRRQNRHGPYPTLSSPTNTENRLW